MDGVNLSSNLAITPSGVVHLLQGVPIDRSYKHTLYFDNKNGQYNFFYGKKVHTLSDMQYARATRSSIKVELTMQQCLNCNYMMFQNYPQVEHNSGTGYPTAEYQVLGDKWYYAFIDRVEYVNTRTTEIFFTVDVMQTWFFDYSLPQQFIDRAHTKTDEVGDNIIPENVPLGDFVTYNDEIGSLIDSEDFVVLIASTVDLSSAFTIVSDRANVRIKPAKANTVMGGTFNGCGLYIYYPSYDRIYEWSLGEIEYFWDENVFSALVEDRKYNAMSFLLKALAKRGFADCIVGIATIPLDLLDTDAQIPQINKYPNNIPTGERISCFRELVETDFTETGIWFFDAKKSGSLGSDAAHRYTPKNNKLYTSPYNFLRLELGDGTSHDYAYEYFTPKTDPTSGNLRDGAIMLRSCLGLMPTVSASPNGYKGNQHSVGAYDERILKQGYPLGSYSYSAFDQWLARNSASLTWGALSGGARTTLGIVENNPTTVISGVSQVGNILANIADKTRMPNAVSGTTATPTFDNFIKHNGIYYRRMCVTSQYAKIIDDYFTKEGYAIKCIEQPYRKARSSFTYLKLVDCMVDSNNTSWTSHNNSGLPAQAQEQIEKIFEAGVTFWYDYNHVGDYTRTNTPLGNNAKI